MSKQDTEQAVAEVAQEVADDTDLPLVLERPQQAPGTKPTASDRIITGELPTSAYFSSIFDTRSRDLLFQFP